jgi:hypothetical protein
MRGSEEDCWKSASLEEVTCWQPHPTRNYLAAINIRAELSENKLKTRVLEKQD